MEFKGTFTIYEENELKTKSGNIRFEQDVNETENQLINLYPQMEYQTFHGFGGACTEAAGYSLSKLGEEKFDEVVKSYFSKEGMGYRFIRTHIDSCDFSLGNYSAVEEEQDTQFTSFSLERDARYVQPLLKKALSYGENIEIMLTPWSPPAFMKTNGTKNNGGKLKKEYYLAWAKYICKYIKEYKALGFPVTMISVQNEPKAVQTWDSCVFTAEEEKDLLQNYLKPELIRNGLEEIRIIIWDHNKERAFERANDMIDDNTKDMVNGIGFHWYSGDHFEALALIRDKYPDKEIIFTEGCVEYSRFGAADVVANAEMYAHDIIGNLNAGMNTWIDWNIALDEKGGPNHVGNFCDAPVMCDTIAGEYEYKLSFHYIGQFSRNIKPGAKRIGFSRYTDKLEVTAFKNPDQSIAVVILNRTKEELPALLRINKTIAKIEVAAHSIVSGIIA